MAASGQRLIPLSGMNLDVAPQYLKDTQARFIKNLYYQLSDLGEAGTAQGAQTGVLKPLPSNEIYCPISLPAGNNHVIGTLPSRETNELYVFVYNSQGNHCIFLVDGVAATCTMVKIDPCFDFKLEPQYFIGEGQCHVEIIYLKDPTTGEQIVKKDLYWTLGINYQGYLRVGDSIATNGFDATKFPYFAGDYDKCPLVRMGLPTPNDCIKIEEEVFNPETDTGQNNNLKFSSWQFRVLRTDVWGRQSEHGIISDLYFLSNNDCLGASDELSRCVKLTFDAGNPIIDKVQIEFRNCNDEQWYLDTVLDLYDGSNIGEWWKRPRNSDVAYNPTTNQITYTFCKDKLCDPIPTSETNRTQNDLPRSSQALTKIGRDLALSNNTSGFAPFGKDIMDKVSVEIVKPVPSQVGDTANITVWIRIYNPYLGFYTKVWKKDDDYVFGGISSFKNLPISNIKSDYQQYFAVNGQRGFLGYLAGTNNYAIGEQYYVDANNNLIKDEDFTNDNTLAYFQRFEFSGVPKGNYVFRLASHLANPNVVDIKKTSTYVGGVWNAIQSPSNLSNVVGTKKNENKEVIINVCTKDYDTFESGEILLAYDMTRPVIVLGAPSSQVTVLDGYVFEGVNSISGDNENPVELLSLSVNSNHSNVNSFFTDHNGFYFAGSLSQSFTVTMTGYCNCVKKPIVYGSAGNGLRRYELDLIVGGVSGSLCSNYELLDCTRVLIKGKIQLCNRGTGVPNVNVVYSRGGIGVTDSNGEFTIIAHDDATQPFRSDNLYVMGGGCAFTACDGGCIEVKNVVITPCGTCSERIINVPTYEVLFITSKGLLSGGRYGVSLNGYDWLSRRTFAQTTDKLFFTLPSLNEIKTFGFSQVSVIIPPSITFHREIEYLTVGITAELNYAGNYISWIADKVEFVDNSGNINDNAPTQIKIYYGSLNEYNSKNNFNTTTGWQIIPEGTNFPRTADKVQFIRNGDGTWFNNPITALIKYDQAGQYFLINYTEALKDLKENALIRLANPDECASKDIFFELCGRIDIVDGHAQQNKITLNAFDTYYQYRQIPVPVTTGSGDTAETIIELRQFGFPFEHSSITDTWGYRCWNIGRINIRNPYEAELIHLNQIALSGALSVNAQLNYLHYFEESNKKDFNINGTGGIVYVRVKTGLLLVICQYKNFIVGYGDNVARLNAENIITVASGDSTFGNPERTYSGNFGCILYDKNTIREVETAAQAFCQWLDRKEVAILQNDFQQTVDVSRYNKGNSTIVSWLTQKLKYQNDFNTKNNNSRYFHAVINPLNFSWLLSEFTIGSENYVNEEREVNVSKHETISLDVLGKTWNQFLSPTPEYFGILKGADNGQFLFSFKHGIPYSHSGSTYNTFFGIKCQPVYRFIFNTDGFKKKKFQSLWSYCVQQLLWSDLILTETQKSRLLKNRFKKHDYFWSASFLCDINTPADPNTPQVAVNTITEGNNLFGSYLDVRLLGDANGEYLELYGVIVFAAGDEQSG